MIRLLLRLLKITDFETCKSCEILKQQLLIANVEKKELTETLLSLIQPKIIQEPSINVPAFEDKGKRFGQRRAELERQHSAQRDVRERSPFIAKPSNLHPANSPSEKSVNPVIAETIESIESKLGLGNEDASQVR
jgi:hypothetical protein